LLADIDGGGFLRAGQAIRRRWNWISWRAPLGSAARVAAAQAGKFGDKDGGRGFRTPICVNRGGEPFSSSGNPIASK
jgi:hypothetical protein